MAAAFKPNYVASLGSEKHKAAPKNPNLFFQVVDHSHLDAKLPEVVQRAKLFMFATPLSASTTGKSATLHLSTLADISSTNFPPLTFM